MCILSRPTSRRCAWKAPGSSPERCSYSKSRLNSLKCESGCDIGYIEVEEGICESCENVNPGCYECHYENEYPEYYTKIKRERRFVCDICETGYLKVDGQCAECGELIENCDECEINEENNDYRCTKCNDFGVLENEGKHCHEFDFRTEFKKDEKNYKCSDVNNGGIKGCKSCENNNNNEIICQSCESNYILLSNNNSCLNISENKGLAEFDSCEKLSLDNNNELYCSRCKKTYSLLKSNDNDKGICTKVNIIYDYNMGGNMNTMYNYYSNYYTYKYSYEDEDYNFFNNYNKYPCQESINIGTNDNPIYSCEKCYNSYDYNFAFIATTDYIRIINERNNVSYCYKKSRLRSEVDNIDNCTEAINKTKDGIEKYDCTKCFDENILKYDEDLDIHYCEYSNTPKKCIVHYCKSCQIDNNYICNESFDGYVVSNITGKCMNKSETTPTVLWEDIFNFEKNINKQIEKDGQIYNGPSLNLRGMTSSKIDKNHAFIIYIFFKIKVEKTRNLEENERIKLKTICEIDDNSLKESSDGSFIVDYHCISNNTLGYNLDNYELDEIEQENNKDIIKNSNDINELLTSTDITKSKSSFSLDDFFKYANFIMDEIQNQTPKNFIFDFKINGKLDKYINKANINVDLELNEIDDKAKCNFVIEDNKIANLNCKLDINKYKNNNIFSFKTLEINNDDNNIFMSKLDEVYLINDEKIKDDEKKKTNAGVIAGCIIAGLIVIAGGIGLGVFLYKRKKLRNVAAYNMVNAHSNQGSNLNNINSKNYNYN